MVHFFVISPSRRLDTDDYEACLLGHIRAIRKLKSFQNSTIVLAVENNLGAEGTRLPKLVKKKFHNVFVVHQNDRPGIWTSEAVKITMANMMQTHFHRERVYYSKTLVSVAPESNSRQMLGHFIDQVSDFSRTLVVSNKNSMKVKTRITGKQMGFDDLAMAFCICIYAMEDYMLTD